MSRSNSAQRTSGLEGSNRRREALMYVTGNMTTSGKEPSPDANTVSPTTEVRADLWYPLTEPPHASWECAAPRRRRTRREVCGSGLPRARRGRRSSREEAAPGNAAHCETFVHQFWRRVPPGPLVSVGPGMRAIHQFRKPSWVQPQPGTWPSGRSTLLQLMFS